MLCGSCLRHDGFQGSSSSSSSSRSVDSDDIQYVAVDCRHNNDGLTTQAVYVSVPTFLQTCQWHACERSMLNFDDKKMHFSLFFAGVSHRSSRVSRER